MEQVAVGTVAAPEPSPCPFLRSWGPYFCHAYNVVDNWNEERQRASDRGRKLNAERRANNGSCSPEFKCNISEV